MSDNNGVYILETKDGYRVRYGSYLERVTQYAHLVRLFAGVPRFTTKHAAVNFANLVDSANGPTEFGVIVLSSWRQYNFEDLINGSRGLQ